MEKDEATNLLAACIPLAGRLTAGSVWQTYYLTVEEQAALSGFNRVEKAGWLSSHEIYQRAGLTANDIGYLSRMAVALDTGKDREQASVKNE